MSKIQKLNVWDIIFRWWITKEEKSNWELIWEKKEKITVQIIWKISDEDNNGPYSDITERNEIFAYVNPSKLNEVLWLSLNEINELWFQKE
jgi:hypothetical protein